MENQITSREAELFADIKKGVMEYPEYAMSILEKQLDETRHFARSTSFLFGHEDQRYSSSLKEVESAEQAHLAVDSVICGVEPSEKAIKALVNSNAGIGIAWSVSCDDFVPPPGFKASAETTVEIPVQINNEQKAVNEIESRAEKLQAQGQDGSQLGEDTAIADINSFTRIQSHDWQRHAAAQIAENFALSPKYQVTFKANAPGIFEEIASLNKENARLSDEKEMRKMAEFAKGSQPVDKEPSHSKLFELSDIPNSELLTASLHYGTRVSEYAARANGGPYKGEILETDSHLVQLVSSKSIVFHRKSDVTLPEGIKNVNGHELSIYYKEGTAKAYRLDPVKDQLDRAVASIDRAAKSIGLPESFGEQLTQARNEAWKGIQASRNPIRETKEPTQEQDAPKRSPSR